MFPSNFTPCIALTFALSLARLTCARIIGDARGHFANAAVGVVSAVNVARQWIELVDQGSTTQRPHGSHERD